MRFADTNVLLYSISRDRAETAKAAIANELLTAGDLGLSVQVLQEFYVQATRSTRTDSLTHRQAVDLVTAYSRFPVQETTVELAQAAMATRERSGLSYWDAAILEAARSLGGDTVLSEDLADEQDDHGVVVVNRFR